jgi:L-ornithine Nalpha-acyltransferase
MLYRLAMSITQAKSATPNLAGLTAGSLSLLLTKDEEAIKEAQKLRYRVFFPNLPQGDDKLDVDEFDALCDHLLVLDNQPNEEPSVVGTYRFLRRDKNTKIDKFYTASEFDISKLVARTDVTVMELGRSCVDPEYRDGSVIQLLWKGIGKYMIHHKVRFLFGCASFPSANPADHKVTLSYLLHHHLAPEDIRPEPLPALRADFTPLPAEEIPSNRRAFAALPPLIKGYLRLGGAVSGGAVIDKECNTTDVSMVVDATKIGNKYISHFANVDSIDY